MRGVRHARALPDALESARDVAVGYGTGIREGIGGARQDLGAQERNAIVLRTRREVDSSERVALRHPDLGIRAPLGQPRHLAEGARFRLLVLLDAGEDVEGSEPKRPREPLLRAGALQRLDQGIGASQPPHRIPDPEDPGIL